MKKATLLLILSLALLFSGCGKKEELVLPDNVISETVEEAQEESTDAALVQEEVTTPADEEPEQIEENIVSLQPVFDLVSEYEYVNDENNEYSVGRFLRSYVQPNEETRAAYPALADALDEYNDGAKSEFDSLFPDFCDNAKNVFKKNSDSYCWDVDETTVVRADTEYTCFCKRHYSSWGNGDPFDEYYCVNLDNRTGKPVDINDVVLDANKFNAAINSVYSSKYDSNIELNLFDPQNPELTDCCLTPLGINVYIGADNPDVGNNFGKFISIGFDQYPDVLNDKYKSQSDDYVYPFNAYEEIYADIDNDGEINVITFEPTVSQEYEGYNDYGGYTVSVDGNVYDDFAGNWFIRWELYYVHKNDGNYIYAYFEDYETKYVHIIKFEDLIPTYSESIGGNKLCAVEIPSINAHSNYKYSAFTNSSVITDVKFGEAAVGSYLYVNAPTEDLSDSPKHLIEIYEIDGKYYIEYLSENYYGAGEIELLSDKPEISGGEFVYNIRIHYFSGFSFSGDFQGEGYECTLAVHKNGMVSLSEGTPFSEDTVELSPFYDIRIHESIQDYRVYNEECMNLCGSWRSEEADNKSESYVEFMADGTGNYVVKKETYPVHLNIGIYNVEQTYRDGEYEIRFDGEKVGYANQPFEGALFIYNADKDTLTLDGTEFYRTKSGECSVEIEPGPASRVDEVKADWELYNSPTEE